MASSHGYGLRGGISRKYFPESWKICRFSASALRAVRKKRHPEMPFARSRPGSRPSGGFVARLAFDHQMTPPSPGPLIGPSALPRPSASARLSGTPSAALRPKASHRAGLRKGKLRVGRRALPPSPPGIRKGGSLSRLPPFSHILSIPPMPSGEYTSGMMPSASPPTGAAPPSGRTLTCFTTDVSGGRASHSFHQRRA